MHSRSLVSTILAASLLSGAGAGFAQRQDGDQGRHEERRDDRHDGRHDERRDGRSDRRDFHPGADRGRPGYERGAGPAHAFHRGDRLPPEYRNRRYVVSDWRSRHLSAPPRGYQWVQTGGDLVLVAIATGVIAQLLLSN